MLLDWPTKRDHVEFAKMWSSRVEILVAEGKLAAGGTDVSRGLEGNQEGIWDNIAVSGIKLTYKRYGLKVVDL
jgi:hypothetical protein